jgi:hypothetical protein
MTAACPACRLEWKSWRWITRRSGRELEVGDLTALVIRAIYAICANSAILPETHPEWVLKTSEITAAAKTIVEDDELDFDAEHINSRRVGKVLGKLRIGTAGREAGRGARRWKVTQKDLDTWQRAYLLTLPSVLQGYLGASGANGGHGANGAEPDIDLRRVTL